MKRFEHTYAVEPRGYSTEGLGMTRYYRAGQGMGKVGCVAHQLLAPDAQQYVKAETFDEVVEERNALRAQVDWQAAELQRPWWGLLAVTGVMLVSFGWVVYQLWAGCRV